MPSPTILTFGYGSNLCIDRLEARLGGPGAAEPIGVGYLARYDLRFHKRSQDRHGDPIASAKADALYTRRAGDRVWGVVFRVERSRLPLLDEAEGRGHGYRRVRRRITLGGERLWTWVYLATEVTQGLVPYDWYRRLMLDGLRSWRGIPKQYIQRTETQVPRRPDPVTTRAQREWAWVCPRRRLTTRRPKAPRAPRRSATAARPA